nr:hypothetical protein [Propionicimonas sp.]
MTRQRVGAWGVSITRTAPTKNRITLEVRIAPATLVVPAKERVTASAREGVPL